ncbi:MAG: hypothetical protein V1936_02470 [Patescibacteria group bacterium]
MPKVTQLKRASWTLAVLLVITILISVFWYFNLFHKLFGAKDFYAVRLVDDETWYGQIMSEDETAITLDHVYHFHDNNFSQLISHDTKRNPPKKIPRQEIISLEILGEQSPILKAIRDYEK